MRSVLIFFLCPVLYAQIAIGPVTDPYAASRVAPTGFPTLPVLPIWVNAPLQVGLSTDSYNAFVTKYSAQLTKGWIKVNTSTGNDTTCVVNTTKACASLGQALRRTSDSYIYVTCPVSGTYSVAQFGATNHTDIQYYATDQGNGVKMVIFDKPCHVTFPGDNISTNTWTADAGHANTYKTTISCYPTTCGGILAVLRNDQNDGSGFTDEWGTSFPDRLYYAVPNAYAGANGVTYSFGQYAYSGSYVLYQCNHSPICTDAPPSANWTTLSTGSTNWDTQSLSNLDLLSEGEYFSPSTGTLHAKLNDLDLTNPTNAAKLSARYYPIGGYTDFAGNAPTALASGTVVFWQNTYFDGINVASQEQNVSGIITGQFWLKDGTIFDSYQYGAYLRGGSLDVLQNVVIHASAQDGSNQDDGIDGAYTSVEHIYVHSELAGDPNRFYPGVLPGTLQSQGESSHDGLVAVIGSIYSQNTGCELGDEQRSGVNLTWAVGSVFENRSAFNGPPYNGGQVCGLAANGVGAPGAPRAIWADTSLMTNETISGSVQALFLENGATCKLYNNTIDLPIFYNGAGPCTTYTPNIP